jgi:hypothetical protein
VKKKKVGGKTETIVSRGGLPTDPGEIILYRTEDGKAELQLRAEDGSVWLTQLEIAELFATTKQNVSLHIKNVLEEGELPAASVVKDSLTTAGDGKTYKTKCFSLPMILAVGYRVRSPRGTQFRQWARGWAMPDRRRWSPIRRSLTAESSVLGRAGRRVIRDSASPGSRSWSRGKIVAAVWRQLAAHGLRGSVVVGSGRVPRLRHSVWGPNCLDTVVTIDRARGPLGQERENGPNPSPASEGDA